MLKQDVLKDIELLIRSKYGLIFLDTLEDERAAFLLRHLADRMKVAYFSWTPANGLVREGQKGGVYGTADPMGVLGHIEASSVGAIYHLIGFEDYIGDRVIARRLRDVAQVFSGRTGAIIITLVAASVIPEQLRRASAVVRLPEPGIEEYRELLNSILRDLYQKHNIDYRMTDEDVNRLLVNLKGLTLVEVEKILTKVIIEDGVLSPCDIEAVVEAKRQIVEREGLLEYYPAKESMEEVADMSGLKAWLSKRKGIVLDPGRAKSYGLTFPKGILLLGVPGCGKSLCAKAVASEWGLPLLKFDPSSLYDKYIGETEKNFRRAVSTAEKVAPVVLWIDEIEKAFSSSHGSEDGGVSARLFGGFLSWMQERKADVFIVATANDVERLPPEFLRKGRFDEIFFVDLPDEQSRRSIFEIHLRRRGKDPACFDLDSLAQASAGFSGSEIEQVIISALYTAFSSGTELTTGLILDEIYATLPLSVTMKERIEYLRDWAFGRTVSANG
ncbi:MAG: AAA family ATPase [Candidatus Caldarchaeum sp.]